MNILFVCHRLPFPPDHGGKIRAFHMIRHLGAKHSVTVASLAESQQEVDDGVGLKEHCVELIAEIIPRSVRWLRAWKALFSSCPSSVAYFHSPTLHERIQTSLLANHFDCIIVHCAFVAEYVLGTNVPF